MITKGRPTFCPYVLERISPMEFPTNLTTFLTNSLTKGDLNEEFTITPVPYDPGKGEIPKTLSNEQIRRGDRILDTYTVMQDGIPGGMGSVWCVHHEGWNVDLAMKRPHPKYFAEGSERRKKNFVKECENWIGLGLHPNIVACYYVREIGGVPSIFSEWMNGGSLKDRIGDGSLYAGTDEEVQERILDIAIQTARGLRYSHENKLIHQDVKPGNILLTDNWDAKVADFGISQAQSQLLLAESQPTPLSSGYTPAYCPAEQANGEAPAPWMDVYAWALTVLEMYVGKEHSGANRLWHSGAEAGQKCWAYFDKSSLPIPKAMKNLLAECLRNETDRVPKASASPKDFASVEKELLKIYQEQTKTNYPRTAVRGVSDILDYLNNCALSFLDLGMKEKAEQCWERALEKGGGSRDALINYTVYSWRKGALDNEKALKRLDEFYAEDPSEEFIKAKAELCIEAGYSPRAAEFAKRIQDDSAREELLRKIDEMPPLTENLIDMSKYQFYRLSSGTLFAGCSKDYYIVDINTGKADREEIKENTGKKTKNDFRDDIQWDLLPADEEKLLYVKNGTPVFMDLLTKKTQPLFPYDDIYRYRLDRSSGLVWFASRSRKVFVYSLKENSIVKTLELPPEKYLPEGNYPPEWYTRGERKYIDGRASQLYTHSHISLDLYEHAMAVNVHYVYHSDMQGWRDEEEENYYGGFSDTEETQEYLYFDRENLNELNRYSLDKGAYLSFDPLPVPADQTAYPRTDVWRSSFEKNDYKKSKRNYKLIAPGSDQVMFQCDYLFLSNRGDSIALIAWDKPSYRSYILKLPDPIERMPWRLCHVQDPKAVREIGQRAAGIEKEFMTAIESGDCSKAISLYDEYGTIPGYAFSDFEGKMEDALACCCKRSGVKEVAPCVLEENISVSDYKSFAETTPESLEFIDRMRRSRRPWRQPVQIDSEMHYPDGFKLCHVMRDKNTIVVREYPKRSFREKISPYAIVMKGKRGRYLLIRMSDSRLIDSIPFRFTGPIQNDKGWDEGTDVKLHLGMSPDGRWLLCNQKRYDLETLQTQDPFPLTVFRRYDNSDGFKFSPDSQFVCVASPDGDRIVNMETLQEWVIPPSLHLDSRYLVFSSNGRFLVWGENGREGFRIRWEYEVIS